MRGTDRAVGRLVDHEAALRDDARALLASPGSLDACCARLAGGRGTDLVLGWSRSMTDGDLSPEQWPVEAVLGILMAGAAGGDLGAARLVRPMRNLRKGVQRFGVLAWLAKDPRARREADAA